MTGKTRPAVKTDRRGFFRMLGSAIAFLSGGAAAAAGDRVFEIHSATANTRLGALGVRLRSDRDRLSPFKLYPGSRRLELPPVETPRSLPLADAVRRYAAARAFREESLSLAELSRLLYFTNGVTGRLGGGNRVLHLRAAPSAGALYAGEVYVMAERVRGLAPGLYYYAVVDHELVALRSGSLRKEMLRALERPAAFENAAAVVLLTNVFARYSQRYANRGYRYALIDSGHIGENLRLAAASAGYGEAAPLRLHDDALGALLGVDGREEAVCAAHAVGRAADAAPEAPAVRSFAEKQRARPGAVPGRGLAPQLYHEATKLVPSAPVERAAPVPTPTERSGSGVPLPKAGAAPSAAVERTISERRSAEEFFEKPLALGDLGFVLEMAQGHAALERAPGVELFVAVHRVQGLDPGLYRYEPGAHRLVLLRAGDLRASMTRACWGMKRAGTAGVGFAMVGRLAESAARAGDRSYRDLLLEAGAIGQRIYLAAEAAGLVARNLAAFLDEEFDAFLGLDGRREAAIHLTVLGHGR